MEDGCQFFARVQCEHVLMVGAVALQVGPQGVGLKVKEPKKYNFDPKSLLLQICEVQSIAGVNLYTPLYTLAFQSISHWLSNLKTFEQ